MKADPAQLYADEARRRCLEVAQEIVDEIQANPRTPTESHEMEQGYRAIYDYDGALIVNPVYYWRFQEFGTRYMHENPHVRPAIEAVMLRNRGRR